MSDHEDTSLGDDIENGLPGYGRTFDEAIEDAFHHGKELDRADPGWYKIEASFVRIENPIREYKVVITPGG
jgi:hypothetical protein